MNVIFIAEYLFTYIRTPYLLLLTVSHNYTFILIGGNNFPYITYMQFWRHSWPLTPHARSMDPCSTVLTILNCASRITAIVTAVSMALIHHDAIQ